MRASNLSCILAGMKGSKPISTISKPHLMSAAALTMSTWAKPIDSLDLVPPVYQDFFADLLSDGREFPNTVLTPAFERLFHKTTEKIICDAGDEIWVMEKVGSACQLQRYPLEGIAYVEHRTMLLDSRIKISGLTRQGDPTSSTLKFNTVTDYLLIPFLEKIRLSWGNHRAAASGSELDKFNYLSRSNYKFMNFARRSLMAGERVIHAVFQPEIKERRLALLGMTFYKTISPAHMCILTDRELILIRDTDGHAGRDKYGGTWDYIRLNQIRSASLSWQDDHRLSLSIELPAGEKFHLLYSGTMKEDVDQMLARLPEKTLL